MLLEEIQLTNLLSGGQKKALLSAINEALAINDELLELTDSVYSKFKTELGKTQFHHIIGEEHNIKYKAIEVDTEFKHKPIKIWFRCFNILDPTSAETYEDKYHLGNAETVVDLMEVAINAEFLSGTLKTNIKSLLQHELEHLFQTIQGKRLNSYVGESAYNRAYKILKNRTQDQKLFYVSYIIYTLSESEIDAFVNQLYQELSSAGVDNAVQALKESNAYGYYLNSKKLLKLIKTNREEFEDIIAGFGFSYERFLKLFSKQNRRYITKIGKVLARFNNENQPTETLFNDLDKRLNEYKPDFQ